MESADDIFLQGREITDVAARAAYLANACGQDDDLLHQVEMMLRDADAAQEFFDRADKVAATEAPLNEGPGAVIGRYKLLEKIGEGGMGVVYMAQQREPVVRKVALKIIKAGMDTRQVITRFEAERQALALMDDPNIAKVLDGGATKAGRPYFVMELVQGLPITQFCDEAKLSMRERLGLFLDVCSAIQHAHQKGIIHRDIKPSNILVTLHGDKPVPKVIDFGIAKATQQPLTDKTLFTQFQNFIGTPAYMSPEQTGLSGLDIDTRSDIYALGVLLYELLTGKTPFDGKELLKAGLDEMRRTIKEKEPPRPSTRLTTLQGDDVLVTARRRGTDALKLLHQVRGDLDWIVMKCLEKDRARRYETANGLVADIEHHLNNEPVLARPPSTAYRFQKFVRRNKLQVTAAIVVATVLIMASVVSTWQAVEARRERQIAKQQAQLAKQQSETAKAIKDFLTEQLLSVQPKGKPKPDTMPYEVARPLLERVARQVEGKFADQPQVEVEIRVALRKSFAEYLDHTNAITQGQKVLEIRRRLFGPDHSDTLESTAMLAGYYTMRGEIDEAERLFNDVLPIAQRSPSSSGAGWVLYKYGGFLRRTGRPAEALLFLNEGVEILKKTLDSESFCMHCLMGDVANATEKAGHWQEAEKLWAEGARQCERDYGPEHQLTISFQFALARLLIERKRWQEGMPLLEKVILFRQRMVGTNELETLDAEYWLGVAYEQQGRTNEAIKLFTRIHPHIVGHLPNGTAKFLSGEIAKFFVVQKDYEELKKIYGPLSESYETIPAAVTWEFETSILATAAMKGWPAAAEICRKQFDQFTDSLAIWRTKATVLLYSGDTEKYQQAVAGVIALAATAKSRKDQTEILNVALLGTTEFSPEHVRQFEALVESLEHNSDTTMEQGKNAALRAIGGILFRLGRLTNSLEHLDQAAQKYPADLNRARVLIFKTLCLHRLGRSDEARVAFDEAESIVQSNLLKRLNESEGFLSLDERTCLILRREALALLGPK
jgi:eukaryotic-like serine/threonine-protein kinase